MHFFVVHSDLDSCSADTVLFTSGNCQGTPAGYVYGGRECHDDPLFGTARIVRPFCTDQVTTTMTPETSTMAPETTAEAATPAKFIIDRLLISGGGTIQFPFAENTCSPGEYDSIFVHYSCDPYGAGMWKQLFLDSDCERPLIYLWTVLYDALERDPTYENEFLLSPEEVQELVMTRLNATLAESLIWTDLLLNARENITTLPPDDAAERHLIPAESVGVPLTHHLAFSCDGENRDFNFYSCAQDNEIPAHAVDYTCVYDPSLEKPFWFATNEYDCSVTIQYYNNDTCGDPDGESYKVVIGTECTEYDYIRVDTCEEEEEEDDTISFGDLLRAAKDILKQALTWLRRWL
jgi:hypothetical protein